MSVNPLDPNDYWICNICGGQRLEGSGVRSNCKGWCKDAKRLTRWLNQVERAANFYFKNWHKWRENECVVTKKKHKKIVRKGR